MKKSKMFLTVISMVSIVLLSACEMEDMTPGPIPEKGTEEVASV